MKVIRQDNYGIDREGVLMPHAPEHQVQQINMVGQPVSATVAP
jgi:hypothetical protein